MGCINYDECGYVFNVQCMNDPDCAPLGENYFQACEYIINGSVTSGTCSEDCRLGLTVYLDYMWPNIDSQNPDDYCECAPNNGDCESIGGIVNKYYISVYIICFSRIDGRK